MPTVVVSVRAGAVAKACAVMEMKASIAGIALELILGAKVS